MLPGVTIPRRRLGKTLRDVSSASLQVQEDQADCFRSGRAILMSVGKSLATFGFAFSTTFSGPAISQELTPHSILGMDRLSCDAWLSSDGDKKYGNAMLTVYWATRNGPSGESSSSKSGPDIATALGHIEAMCKTEPTTNLGDMTERYLHRFDRDGASTPP